jgi:hypothetical protein
VAGFDDLSDQALERSIALLRANSVAEGFLASSEKQHYRAVWARDALYTSLGASLTGLSDIVDTSRRTLLTLARLQAPLGQIPNAYWPEQRYWDWGEAGSLDGAALFVIAAWQYFSATGDRNTLRSLWPHLDRALSWMRAQDPTNIGLVTSPEAADWMDSSLKRSGKVLYVNVLYAWAAQCAASAAAELGLPVAIEPEAISGKINLLFWPTDPDAYDRLLAHVPYPDGAQVRFPHPASLGALRGATGPRCHYLSHLTYGRVFDRCDVLGNLLAILVGVADDGQTGAILDYLADVAIDDPFPVRVWPSPELPDDPDSMLDLVAERHQGPEWRNPPYAYHNAGVWPFVGGFYVAALAKAGRHAAATESLRRLALANQGGIEAAWEFREWLDGQTGEPHGAAFQSWNAGCYVLAHLAVLGEIGWLPG